jgi:hypothetical protein
MKPSPMSTAIIAEAETLRDVIAREAASAILGAFCLVDAQADPNESPAVRTQRLERRNRIAAEAYAFADKLLAERAKGKLP